MRKIKLIIWVAGLSIVGGAMTTAPASAQQASHSNTATNVSNNPAATFGFQPLTNTPGVGSSIQRSINGIGSLTGGGGVTTAPASANLTNDAGTAANVSNDPAATFGFQPLTNTPGVGSSIQGSINGIGSLSGGRQGDTGTSSALSQETLSSNTSPTNSGNSSAGGRSSSAGGRSSSADSADISADTRTALLALSERLNGIDRGLWGYGDALDQNIRDVAAGLLRDLTTAQLNCNQAKTTDCARLSRLVIKINGLLQNLETLRNSLVKNGQKARIF